MTPEYLDDWLDKINTQVKPPYIVTDLIANTSEVNAIAGRSGIGKTNLCLQLAFSLSTGKPFLDFDVPKPAVSII